MSARRVNHEQRNFLCANTLAFLRLDFTLLFQSLFSLLQSTTLVNFLQCDHGRDDQRAEIESKHHDQKHQFVHRNTRNTSPNNVTTRFLLFFLCAHNFTVFNSQSQRTLIVGL